MWIRSQKASVPYFSLQIILFLLDCAPQKMDEVHLCQPDSTQKSQNTMLNSDTSYQIAKKAVEKPSTKNLEEAAKEREHVKKIFNKALDLESKAGRTLKNSLRLNDYALVADC